MPERRPVSRVLGISAAVFELLGAALMGGGAWLAYLGGSIYYLNAGVGLVLTGILLGLRRPAALWLYAGVLLGTLIWAIVEIGFDWWPLAARLDILWPLGVWLLLPWVTRPLSGTVPLPKATTGPLLAVVLAGALALAIGLGSTYGETDGTISGTHREGATALTASVQEDPDDWRSYGRTALGQRYSPIAQITPANVTQLRVAWTFRTGDLPTKHDPVETTFEVTPIKVRGTLYLCSQHQRLFALDAKSGALRWSFDPKIHDSPVFQHLTCRGVSYHERAPSDAVAVAPAVPAASGVPAVPGAACRGTIFLPVNDGRIIALDADTGKPCDDFADHGTLDLQTGMGVTTAGFYEPTSPPVVSDRVLVVAGAVIDNYSTQEPSGVIRGFDIRTGALLWAWDSANEDENELPSATHHYTNNSPNSWITASYDAHLGLAYFPMGVQTPDIWGGNRTPLAERYSSALVALDIDTGKRVWSYQTVHHDLWDMDLPAQPSLMDLPTAAGVVPAILQPAKTGNLFVLDRRTGQPLVPAPERPVPQGAAPGDYSAPTQPFSELTFRPEQLLTGADMWGATLFDQLACRILFHRLRYQGTFTPPSLQGTLVFPGNLGMFEWGGIAVDPERMLAIANPIAIPYVSRLLPRGPENPPAPNARHPPGSEVGVQPMYGAPFGVDLRPFLSPLGLPCKRPPWGFMAGIDLRTRKIVWMHRNGTIRDSLPPLQLPPIKMGVPGLGGPMTTAGGVAFLTSTQDNYIRAYDVTNGRQLWQDRLPAGGQSTPMSYAVAGRQYVVTAAGGHGSFHTKIGDYVIAYALPN